MSSSSDSEFSSPQLPSLFEDLDLPLLRSTDVFDNMTIDKKVVIPIHVKAEYERQLINYLKEGKGKKPSLQLITDNSSDNHNCSFSSRKSVSPVLSKNAIAARENRQKKKKYVEEIECKISTLEKSVKDLDEKYKKSTQDLKLALLERDYYKKLALNSSEIAAIMKNVIKTPGLQFTSSSYAVKQFDASNINTSETLDQPMTKKLRISPKSTTQDDIDSGICLHISKGSVSFEFCPTCAENALQAKTLAV